MKGVVLKYKHSIVSYSSYIIFGFNILVTQVTAITHRGTKDSGVR